MPYISPEVIQEAKRMDLFTYLQTYEPQELVHFSGNVYCTRSHDSLKISNGKWCWHSRGIGGRSALDYLIKVNGMSFLGAMEESALPPALKQYLADYPQIKNIVTGKWESATYGKQKSAISEYIFSMSKPIALIGKTKYLTSVCQPVQ